MNGITVTFKPDAESAEMYFTDATRFTVDEKGYLDILQGHENVARFAPGWLAVRYNEEPKP